MYIEGVFNGKIRSVELEDEWGKILIYMLPFVKPCDVRCYYPEEEINSYDDAIRVIVSNSDIDYSKRNVLMLHQFVTASGVEVERSDSETLSLGSSYKDGLSTTIKIELKPNCAIGGTGTLYLNTESDTSDYLIDNELLNYGDISSISTHLNLPNIIAYKNFVVNYIFKYFLTAFKLPYIPTTIPMPINVKET